MPTVTRVSPLQVRRCSAEVGDLQHAANSVNHGVVRHNAVIASCSCFVQTLQKVVRESLSGAARTRNYK